MNLRSIGPVELLIIAGIVILLFGVGRLGKIGAELGKGIREFRRSIRGEDELEAESESETEETAKEA